MMAIAKGVRLGPYEILARIGEGGMGEVWKARDSRIGREVAIKVLAESFTEGDQRLWRFEQEARAAGALNHPGLVTIFDVGTTGGSPYIVMELLEGQTLREAIGDPTPTPLPLRRAIDYAIQIASALSVAHDKGIIHRDLKPENVFITSEGRVKILDFGLAKLGENASASDEHKELPRHMTSAGIVVGTPGYMSPEQVRAKPLDHRTDIFSFGSVLYEMLSGRPAFECPSAIETMHAILNAEPESLSATDPGIPDALDAIVFHCLEKNPRDRFQSARDLAFQLRTLPETQKTASDILPMRSMPATVALQSKSRTRFSRRALLIAIAAGVLALGAGGFALYRVRAVEPQTSPRLFKQLTFSEGLELFPSLAPDGKSFVYVSAQSGNRDIYLQRVDGRSGIDLTGDSPADDSEPAFSPDGGQIAFRSERDGGGIFVMGVSGESVRRLTDAGHNPSWSPDGTRIVYSTIGIELRPHVRGADGQLWIVDTRTGARKVLIRHGVGGPEFGRDSDAVQPSWSPHGHRIAFWGISNSPSQRDLWTVDPDAPEPKRTVVRVAADDASLQWNPVWSPDGQFLYFGSDRDGTLNLWRVPIDEESGASGGPAEPVALPGWINGNFAFSKSGDLVFTTVTRSYRLLALPFDAAGATLGTPRPVFEGTQEILSFAPSPDGQSIAFTTGGSQEDLFIVNADGTRLRQLTNDPAKDREVTWSADGRTLYLHSNRGGSMSIWSIRADGSRLTRVTDDSSQRRIGAQNLYSPNAAPDGRMLVVETDNNLDALVHLDGPPASRIETFPDLGNKGLPKWSPDGQRIAGASRSGIAVYTPSSKQTESILPRGEMPQWLPDGNRLLFFDKRRIGLVDVHTKHETTVAFTPPPGVQLDWSSRLSRDGSTLFVRQTIEQGDIWLFRAGKK